MFEDANLSDLRYPVAPDNIEDLERRVGIGLNVFTFDDDQGKMRRPLHISTYWHDLREAALIGGDGEPIAVRLPENPITLDLLYFDQHWACIRNFSRFMADSNRHEHRRHWCKRCLGSFRMAEQLEEHQLYCRHDSYTKTIVTMPDKGVNDIIKFKNFRAQVRTPFVIFCDIESILISNEHQIHLTNPPVRVNLPHR